MISPLVLRLPAEENRPFPWRILAYSGVPISPMRSQRACLAVSAVLSCLAVSWLLPTGRFLCRLFLAAQPPLALCISIWPPTGFCNSSSFSRWAASSCVCDLSGVLVPPLVCTLWNRLSRQNWAMHQRSRRSVIAAGDRYPCAFGFPVTICQLPQLLYLAFSLLNQKPREEMSDRAARFIRPYLGRQLLFMFVAPDFAHIIHAIRLAFPGILTVRHGLVVFCLVTAANTSSAMLCGVYYAIFRVLIKHWI